MKLTHTRILVNNYNECYQFYKETLSFPCTWGDEKSNYAQFQTGNTQLSIFDKQQMLEDINERNVVQESLPLNEVALTAFRKKSPILKECEGRSPMSRWEMNFGWL